MRFYDHDEKTILISHPEQAHEERKPGFTLHTNTTIISSFPSNGKAGEKFCGGGGGGKRGQHCRNDVLMDGHVKLIRFLQATLASTRLTKWPWRWCFPICTTDYVWVGLKYHRAHSSTLPQLSKLFIEC